LRNLPGKGTVRQFFLAEAALAPLAGVSPPTALLADRDDSRLFVARTNRTEYDALDTKTGKFVLTLFPRNWRGTIWRQ